jgi:hypothetical protein
MPSNVTVYNFNIIRLPPDEARLAACHGICNRDKMAGTSQAISRRESSFSQVSQPFQ